jgi:hypothetical protein
LKPTATALDNQKLEKAACLRRTHQGCQMQMVERVLVVETFHCADLETDG